jgi:hypothetical protein
VFFFDLGVLDVASIVVAFGLRRVLLHGRAVGDFEVLHCVLRKVGWLSVVFEESLALGEF